MRNGCRTGWAVAAVTLLAAICAACQQDATPAPQPAPSTVSLPQAGDPFPLDPARFSTTIDNPYWPMEPGTRWVYREIDEAGEEVRVVVTVTSETRNIANGVVARVVRDTVYEDDQVVEDTFDWYAQDADSTVWYLGEDTAEFEDGEVTSRGGSFEAGVDGALAGVIMPADPTPGMAYRQEYYEGEAEDNGQVLSLDEMVDTDAGHFGPVLLTKDSSGIEPRVLEYKFYAPGVGPVLTLDISGGKGREELVAVTTVPAGVARAAGLIPLGQPYG